MSNLAEGNDTMILPVENNSIKIKFGSQLPSTPDRDCIYFIADEETNTYKLYLGGYAIHADVSAISDTEIDEICK